MVNVGTTITDLGSDAANLAQVTEVAAYFKSVRLAIDIANASGIARQRQQALYAKAAGLRVIYVCSSAPTVGANGITATYFNNTYRPAVLTEAQWCIDNNIDEICSGNEEELRINSGSIVDPFSLMTTYLKPLATAIKALDTRPTKIVTSYSVSQGAESWYFNITPGDIDKIGFNIYGDNGSADSFASRISTFKANANWGSRLYVSEFNTHYDHTKITTDAFDKYYQMDARSKIIQNHGITDIYQFCWKYSASLDWFSIKSNTGTYEKYLSVLAVDRPLPAINFDIDFNSTSISTTYKLVQNDTGPRLNFTLKYNGSVIDLTSAVVRFKFRQASAQNNIFSRQCVISNALNGVCYYDWQSGDLANDGSHIGEIEVTFLNGVVLTCKDLLKFDVRDEL